MNTEVAPGTTRLDLVKKAMQFVIKHLHADDGLAILAFNEKILTHYSTDLFRISGQQMFAQNKVDKIVAKGDTNFSPGIEEAVKILDERSSSDKNSRVGVVMLVTDGVDSRKAAMYPIPPEILKKYPVHTFGICAHDPNVLLSIAQQSCGTYSFVDDDELGSIADPFAILLGGLNSIVAVDVVVQLFCSFRTSFRSSVKLISCGFQSSEIEVSARDDNWSTIRIGMLYAGEVKNFIAHVVIDPDTSAGTRSWGRIYVYYKDAPVVSSLIDGDGNGRELSTGKQAGDSGDNSSKVRGQVVQFNALEFLSTLQEEFKKQMNTAGAKGANEARAAQIRAGNSLEKRWEEFVKTMDDDLTDGLDLDDLKTEVEEMVNRLKQGAGMAYMCSWVSSQQMQRAATLGSADAVGTQFFTSARDAMLSKAKKYHVQLAPGGVGGSSTQPSKLEQRRESWEKLMKQAEQMLNQPADAALAQTWNELKAAIDKAKRSDLCEAMKRGES
ncbi:uncharacterized protein LOC120713037 isoform X3 [Panicum virgatum]|nr:uncharacterized protein LOC120713037 isoform X3 [Panicum virgatum]